jgi:hypothetical protein
MFGTAWRQLLSGTAAVLGTRDGDEVDVDMEESSANNGSQNEPREYSERWAWTEHPAMRSHH